MPKYFVINGQVLTFIASKSFELSFTSKIVYKPANDLRTNPRNVQVILEMARYNPTSNFAC